MADGTAGSCSYMEKSAVELHSLTQLRRSPQAQAHLWGHPGGPTWLFPLV